MVPDPSSPRKHAAGSTCGAACPVVPPAGTVRGWRQLPRRVVAALLRLYRAAVSPYLGPACRFHPTCSRYAEQAVLRHGLARGAWLAARRLGRCHPWHPGGVDPVPPALPSRTP